MKELTGEATVLIRKGKKIVTYEYKASLEWGLINEEEKAPGVDYIGGEYELPEISNDVLDDGDEWDIECRFTTNSEEIR